MADDMKLQIILESQNESAPGFEDMNSAMGRIQEMAEGLTKTFTEFASNINRAMEQASESLRSLRGPIQEDARVVATAFEGPSKMATEQLSQIVSGFEPIVSAAEKTANAVAKDFEAAAVKSEEALKGIASGGTGSKDKKSGGLLSNDTSMNMLWGGMTFSAMGAGGVKAFESILTPAIAFEKEMRNVQSMTHWNEDTFNQFAKSVQEQAKTLPQTPEQLAKGFYDVVSAGWDASDGMTIMAESAKAASAGIADNETAANALTSVLSAYGLKAQDVTRITDDMFQAVAVGKITFPELAQNLGQVIPTAAALKVPFGQVAGAMALMTNKGVPAAEAATALNRVLLSFVKPSKQASEEAQKLGIDLSATAVQTKGLGGVMQELYDKTGGNIEQIQKIVGDVRGLKGVLDITGNSMQDYNSIMAQMGQASGSTDKALAEQAKGMGYQLQLLKNNFDIIADDLANVMRPAFESFIGILQKVESWFQQLSPAQEKFIMYVMGAVTAIGLTVGPFLLFLAGIGQAAIGIKALKNIFNTVPDLISQTMGSFSKFGGFLIGLGPRIITAVRSAFSWETIITVARTALAAITGPWGVLILAIVAGVGVIIANWDKIKAWAQEHFGGTIPLIWTGLKDMAVQTFGKIKDFFAEVWDKIKAVTEQVWAYIGPTITGAVQKIEAFWNEVWPKLKDIFVEVWNVMAVILSPMLAGLYIIIKTTLAVIEGTWHDVWNIIKSTFKLVWDGIVDILRLAWDVVSGIFKIALDLLTGHWRDAWNDAAALVKNVWNDIETFFKDLVGNAWQWGVNIIKGFADGIKSAASGAWDAIKNIAQTIKNIIGFRSPAKEGPGSDADTWAPNLVNMFATGLSNGATAISNAAHTMIDPLRQVFTSTMADLKTSTGTWVTDMGNQYQQMATGINNTMTKLVDDLKSLLTQLQSTISDAMNNLQNTMTTAFNNIADQAQQAFQKVVDAAQQAMASIQQAQSASGSLGLSFAGGGSGGGGGGGSEVESSLNPGGSFTWSPGQAWPGTSNTASIINNVYVSGNVTKSERALGQTVAKAVMNSVKMQGKI